MAILDRCALAAVALASVAPAQELGYQTLANGLRFRAVRIADCGGVCAVLALAVGNDHDPPRRTGMAQAVAAALRLADAGRRDAERLQIEVRDTATLITAIRPLRELDQALAALAGVVAGDVAIDRDRGHRALARAALFADDESEIFPGSMLPLLARRALLAGTPAGRQSVGIPAELRALEGDDVRRRYHAYYIPSAAILTVLSGERTSAVEDAVRAAFASLPVADVELPAPSVHDPLPAPPAEQVHERLNAPYVAAAWRAPLVTDPDYPAFLVAMEVIRARAVYSMRPRGNEASARAAPLEFSPAGGEPVALLVRRGMDGEDATAVRRELEQFAEDLIQRPPRESEVRRMATLLARQLQLPPYDGAVLGAMSTGTALYPRARVLTLTALGLLPPGVAAAVENVTVEGVVAAMQKALEPGQLRWFSLIPLRRVALPLGH